MTKAERRLSEDRALRNQARGLFDGRLAQVKADLAARSVPGRIKHAAQEKAFDAVDEAVDLAKNSKGLIAATAGALALWFFRKPLLQWLRDDEKQAPVHEHGDTDERAEQQEQEA